MKQLFAGLFLLIACRAAALDLNHFTITRISAPYFIVDGNLPASVTKAYVGFEIKNNSNSAVTYTNLKFTILSIGTSVAGQNYAIVAPSSGITNIGTLAPGESKTCYYYVSYPAHISAQGTFNLQLTDNNAGVKTQAITINNRSCISANAGGTATQTFTNQDLIGGLIYDDVTYTVGNVKSGDEADFQVAVSSSYDPTKITLISTQVTNSAVPGIPTGTTDSLYFVTGAGSNGATITIRWTFRITGTNFTNYLLPCAGATSGSTNYKYALNTALGAGSAVVVSAAANPLTITKTANKTVYLPSEAAVFTITINNPGAYGITIDKITDQLPTGFIYTGLDGTSQVTTSNSTTLPASGATGLLDFEGAVNTGGNVSYYVPAAGSLVLRYRATASAITLANTLTTARNYVGTVEVGNASATVAVSVTLPLTLRSFSGNWMTNDKVLLQWSSLDEMNTRTIEVERAAANNTFIRIGEVAAAGNSSTTRDYEFVDATPSDKNYYRLRIVDIDGNYKYSPVIAINKDNSSRKPVSCFPNPFKETLTLQKTFTKAEAVTIRLFDAAGKQLNTWIKQTNPGTNNLMIDKLNNLPQGLYSVSLITSEEVESFWVYKGE